MAITGDTQLAATKQEIIAEFAQRALINAMTFGNTVRDVSNRAVKGAESISFPKNTNLFAVENRASAAAGTDQDITFGKDTMLLGFRAHIQWLIDQDDEIESTLDVQREYIERAAKQHAAYVDAQIIAAMEADGIATTTVGNISQAVVLEMQQVLLQNKAMPNDLYLQVSPKQHALLLQIDPFVGADNYGRPIIEQGVLGSLYGVKVMMNTALLPDQYFMYETEGMALGFQRAARFDEAPTPEYGAGSKRQVLTQKFGVKSLQIGVPGAFLADGVTALGTKSALIVKDNN